MLIMKPDPIAARTYKEMTGVALIALVATGLFTFYSLHMSHEGPSHAEAIVPSRQMYVSLHARQSCIDNCAKINKIDAAAAATQYLADSLERLAGTDVQEIIVEE